MNDPTAARTALVKEGRLTIEGVDGRFVHGIGRRLRLAAANLRLTGGFETRDGILVETGRIVAEAALVSDSLRRIGRPETAQSLPLAIRSLPLGDQARMLITVGDGDGLNGAGFFAEAHLPPAVFAALKGDVLSGSAHRLSLTAATSLWLDEGESGAAPGLPVTWHLAPGPNGQGSAPARGLIETIDWQPAEARPAPAQVQDTAAAEDEETTSEALARINWSLKQLLIVLAFLMLIIALK